jgi:hypothetical protein
MENNNQETQSRPTIQQLMTDLTDRLKLKLTKDEIPCPTCKGLRFVLVQNGENAFIESCSACYDGKHYICKHCGNSYKTGDCDCTDAKDEKWLKESEEKQKKKQEIFYKAEKIKFDDYNGYFMWRDLVIDKEDLVEELYASIYDNEEIPNYIYATEKQHIGININVIDKISDVCENGCEDMEDYLNFKNEKLKLAQQLIDEWAEEQGDLAYVYYEDFKKVVLLDDVIEELKEEFKSKNI